MEINKLTLRLLSEGYTKESPPDWANQWNDFYGGWTYPVKMLYEMVYETPCGLLTKGLGVHGSMSYMGVNWTVENDNYAIVCPKFDGIPCELNHELLRNKPWGHNEKITHCACRLTDQPYNYERSLEKAHEENWNEANRLWEEFDDIHNGRACKRHSIYSRTTKKWRMHYDPRLCVQGLGSDCQRYCKVLQTEMSAKKGNVFYDVKTIQTEKGFGLFPDTEKASITKGVKLLERRVSVTLCEAIIKHAKHKIIREKMTGHQRRESLLEHPPKYELSNFRCEVRASRDLLQDLADTQEGIEVHHAAVDAKIAAEQKRQRRAVANARRMKKSEKLVMKHGYYNLDGSERRRAEKRLGWERIKELESARKNVPAPDANISEQQSLFGG